MTFTFCQYYAFITLHYYLPSQYFIMLYEYMHNRIFLIVPLLYVKGTFLKKLLHIFITPVEILLHDFVKIKTTLLVSIVINLD